MPQERQQPEEHRSTGEVRGRHHGPSYRILLAEDDEDMRILLCATLEARGYNVTPCTNGVDFLSWLSDLQGETYQGTFDLVIADNRLPGLTTLEILGGIPPRPSLPPLILITAFGDYETHAEARRLGVVAILDKPFELEELVDTATRAIHDCRASNGKC